MFNGICIPIQIKKLLFHYEDKILLKHTNVRECVTILFLYIYIYYKWMHVFLAKSIFHIKLTYKKKFVYNQNILGSVVILYFISFLWKYKISVVKN